MTIFVGEAVTIVGSATDPLKADENITDATAVADFYGPGKDPKGNPEDRTTDKQQVTLTYDAEVVVKLGQSTVTGAYVGFADTTGWAPGKWTYKVTLSGSYDSWEYGTFTLKA